MSLGHFSFTSTKEVKTNAQNNPRLDSRTCAFFVQKTGKFPKGRAPTSTPIFVFHKYEEKADREMLPVVFSKNDGNVSTPAALKTTSKAVLRRMTL